MSTGQLENESTNIDRKNYQKFLEGNQDGFEKLVVKYKDNLIYFIHKYIKNLDEAEDLAQDAFVEILIHKERYNFSTSFKTYLFTIGRNKAIDFIRKRKHQVLMEEMEEQIEEENFLEHHVIKQEEKRWVNNHIKTLKQEYQTAILLIDFEEMSYEEAAKVLHKTMPQMKVLIYRARKSLRKILEKERGQG